MDLNRKHRSDVFWSAIEAVGSTVLAVVTTIMIARFLGPADFGLIMSAFAFVQIGAFFTENAFNDALVRSDRLSESHIRSAYLTSIGLGASLTFVFAAAAGSIAALFDAPALQPAVVVMSATLLCNGISSVPMSLLRRELRFRDLALRTLYARIAGTVVAVVGLLVGLGFWSVVWQQVAAAVVSAACVFPIARTALRGKFSVAAVRELAPMTVFSNATQLVALASHRLYLTAISIIFGPTTLGLFTIGLRLVEPLRGMIQHGAVQLIYRRLALRQNDPAAMLALYFPATRLAASLSVPMFVGLFVTAPYVVPLVLQPQWAAAIDVVRLFALSAAVACLQMFDGALNRAVGRPQLPLLVTVIAAACAFAFLIPLHVWGSAAVEQAWLARAFVAYVCSMLAVWSSAGVSPLRLLRNQFPVVAAAGMMLSLLTLILGLLPSDLRPVPTLAVIVPVGALVYFATLYLLTPATVRRIRQLAFGAPLQSS